MEENTLYLHKDLSYKLVGLCMEIHREYGCGHNERIYHKVLMEKLEKEKIPFVSKPRVEIYSKETGRVIGHYEPDLVIDSNIIVELKAKPVNLISYERQLAEYVMISEFELGYLFNFGLKSLYFKRFIYTNNNKDFLSVTKK